MASGLDSYSGLKPSILDWMVDRQDLGTIAEDCIKLAEGDMNLVLKTRNQRHVVELVPDADGIATLPTDYLMWISATSMTNPRSALTALVGGSMEDNYRNRYSGQPRNFDIVGNEMFILPLNSSVVEFEYFRKIPALSDAQTTNWLLQKYPNVYLWGALKHAAIYIVSEKKASMYSSLFGAGLDQIQNDDVGGTFGMRTMSRVRGPTP